jgi:hypothetical protein
MWAYGIHLIGWRVHVSNDLDLDVIWRGGGGGRKCCWMGREHRKSQIDACGYVELHHIKHTCRLFVGTKALRWVPISMPMPMLTHAHGFWVGMVRCYCSWVGIGFVHPCIQLQIGVKLLGCREYANQEALRAEANDSEQPFICPIQPRLGVGK